MMCVRANWIKMGMSGEPYASAALLPGKGARYKFCRWLGGPQTWSRRGGEKKNLCSLRESNPNSPVVQPIA
jgi:hypothetical protein